MNLVELGQKIGVEGFLHCNELDQLVLHAAGKDCLEVGSFKGLSAWGMAFSAKSLMCVDTFKANSAGQEQMQNYTTFDDFRRSVSRYNNVKWFPGTSAEAAASLTDTYDFIFIDAMHTYEEVKKDIERWWPKLRSGGIFAFHDYNHHSFPGVKQAVDEIFGVIPESNICITLAWVRKD